MRRLRFLMWWSSSELTCAEVAQVLQQYLDNETDDRLASKIEAHLEDCRRCGLEVETYRHIKASLASRRSEVPQDSLARLSEFASRLSKE